jgi:hypothetical protein
MAEMHNIGNLVTDYNPASPAPFDPNIEPAYAIEAMTGVMPQLTFGYVNVLGGIPIPDVIVQKIMEDIKMHWVKAHKIKFRLKDFSFRGTARQKLENKSPVDIAGGSKKWTVKANNRKFFEHKLTLKAVKAGEYGEIESTWKLSGKNALKAIWSFLKNKKIKIKSYGTFYVNLTYGPFGGNGSKTFEHNKTIKW